MDSSFVEVSTYYKIFFCLILDYMFQLGYLQCEVHGLSKEEIKELLCRKYHTPDASIVLHVKEDNDGTRLFIMLKSCSGASRWGLGGRTPPPSETESLFLK